MKIDDDILKYLSGNMETSERARFEDLISKDSDLKSELEEYRSKLSYLKNISEVEPDTNYFNALLPKVREKIDKGRKPSFSLSKKIAYSLPVILILAFILYKQFSFQGVENPKDLTAIIAQMNDSSKSELLTGILEKNSVNDSLIIQNSGQSLSEEINKELTKVLFENNTVINTDEFLSMDTYDFTDSLSTDEAELVYKNLINKKIM